jgi:hypothetical protein
VSEQLRTEAERRYVEATAMLRNGVPKAQIGRATLTAKVVLIESNGGVVAKLANAETIQEHGIAAVSELTVDLGMQAFPAFEP